MDFVDFRNSENTTLLMAASKNGYVKVCEILIKKGAILDLQDKYGATALIYASTYGHKEVVILLMNYGANLLLENKEGKTAFLIAYQNGNVEMANLLQGKPERINHTEINKSLQLNDTAQISTLVQSDKNSKNLMDVLVKQDSVSARLIAPLVDFVDYKDLNNTTLLMVQKMVTDMQKSVIF